MLNGIMLGLHLQIKGNHTMNKYLLSILLPLAIASTSCITMPGPDPARQAALDAKFEAKNASYPSKGKFTKAMPLAVGQYVVHGNISNGRRDSISRMAIVGTENNGLILEMTSSDTRSESTQQILVRGMEQVAAGKAKPETIEILWIKIRDDKGQVQKLEGPMISMMATPLRNTFSKMYTDDSSIQHSDGGTIRVPAGTFAGTSKVNTETRIFGMTIKATSHLHPLVPIYGLVRTESDNGKDISELIDFGTQGAKPSF